MFTGLELKWHRDVTIEPLDSGTIAEKWHDGGVAMTRWALLGAAVLTMVGLLAFVDGPLVKRPVTCTDASPRMVYGTGSIVPPF